ncbi:MAG TPA: maltose alpha-D-glucosyltransferase [Thermoanaerobaculia bacterium]|nr:maltose alpha-D-glucosyltransferase [Thermoanaerobaculia bacterium]
MLETDRHWYKDAVIYELHVRAFADSDGDGIGDFRGLTGKLDYLQELGVTALWLLPFYPSPLKDDGYDIADYRNVHPTYGTLEDFKVFLREAHRRGLKVITELVINHTSDQHPWFQRARRARPGSAARDFYVWSDDPQRYGETRIIFKDYEASNWSWDPVAQAYYWHRFFHHQPDLNFASPQVRREVFRALDFWLQMGVDGLRLDAIPYLFERQGTNCENLPETHAFLKELRRHVDERFADRMLLAEANQWPEDSVAYFGDGDECHMAFHFPVMPRLFMSLRMEDRFPIVDILQQTPDIPAGCQWAIFLRNHDELTLEMVTDEDRDYMYRVYASDPQARINLGIRRRLAPLLGNDRRRMELMNALLFSLPGTPVLYYGDEIGMGDNIYLGDRNGVRTPMQWSADRNAGFSRANPQRLYLPVIIDPAYHYEAANVESQLGNPHSLLWWTRRLIALRQRHQAFGRGSLELLHPDNHRVLAFVRRHGDECILVLANLSRFVQHVELDLAAFAGAQPVELMGRCRLPRLTERPLPLILGPHGFYWFELEASRPARLSSTPGAAPLLVVAGGWESCCRGEGREQLAALLPAVLQGQRWFGGKARQVRALRIDGAVPLTDGGRGSAASNEGHEPSTVWLLLLRVEQTEGEPDTYALPVAWAAGGRGERLLAEQSPAVLARVEARGRGGRVEPGVLYDAMYDPAFGRLLLEAIVGRRTFRGEDGEVMAAATPALGTILGSLPAASALEPQLGRAEQSNTSLVFGDRLILKLFRKVEPGTNPDLEVSRFLAARGFPHTPPLAGWLELRRRHAGTLAGERLTLALLQAYVPNEGDAWSYSLDAFGRYLERVMTRAERVPPHPEPRPLLELAGADAPDDVAEVLGLYLNAARLLGTRTAEMHLALASSTDDPAFSAEPFTSLYQRSLYQSLRSQAGRTLRLLRATLPQLADGDRELGVRLLEGRQELLDRFSPLLAGKLDAQRLRTHGDFHLGQVLYTGRDFVIIDFEGEPARPLAERRHKRSPLRDVAGMLRSFDYLAAGGVAQAQRRGLVPAEQLALAEEWARYWTRWSGATFVRAYLGVASAASFLPVDDRARAVLLDAFLLEKALYELAYELDHRPQWAHIPLRGIVALMAGGG